MPRSLMPCGQPKLSSIPSAPASWVFLVISCHASRFDSTMSETKSARSGCAFLTRAISLRLTSSGRSVINSILLRPITFRPS